MQSLYQRPQPRVGLEGLRPALWAADEQFLARSTLLSIQFMPPVKLHKPTNKNIKSGKLS